MHSWVLPLYDSAFSGFYQYAIPVRHRAELEGAIAAATPGSSELQYAPGFLRRLDHWESEAHGQRTYYVEGFGLIGEADLGRFLPNFSEYITMAGEELGRCRGRHCAPYCPIPGR
jgi:hypothetical protein